MNNTLNKSNAQKNKNSDIVFNQQNNTFIHINSAFDSLHKLPKETQDRIISIAEMQTKHIMQVEREILEEEHKNQQTLRDLAPEQIKYAKRGQIFALIVVLSGFIVSCFLAYIGHPYLSFTSIIISLGVITSQFLGKDLKNSKKQK